MAQRQKETYFQTLPARMCFKKIKLVFAKYSIFMFEIIAINCTCVTVFNIRRLFERCSVMEWRRLQYNIRNVYYNIFDVCSMMDWRLWKSAIGYWSSPKHHGHGGSAVFFHFCTYVCSELVNQLLDVGRMVA